METSACGRQRVCASYSILHKVAFCTVPSVKLEPFRQKYEIKIFILAKEVLASLF